MIAKENSRAVSSSDRHIGLISSGRAPHGGSNAHFVRRTWPYTRAFLYWLLANVALLGGLGVIGYGLFIDEKQWVIYGVAGAFAGLLNRLFFMLASKATPCPLCRSNHLANSHSSKHKDAYKLFPFSFGGSAVMTAFFRRCVRCMHCGVSFKIKTRKRE